MCGWLLNSMKTSGPLPDWIAEVTRGCRSLPFTVSRLILMPSAFIASGSIDFLNSSSDAGTKSFHLIQCTVDCCANTGAWCDARIPASPAPDVCRNLRRVKLAIFSPPPRGDWAPLYRDFTRGGRSELSRAGVVEHSHAQRVTFLRARDGRDL